MIKSFLYNFFSERQRNPAFSFVGEASFRKKSGFLSRADIKNLWLGTYLIIKEETQQSCSAI
ncbi:Uncharacterized protein dnm_098160 [Desulfonema magnum]|uniref:Uncharacterized protein n=1 Tax=Desulfonema magnum TaxID=45655 RepID=A0A975BYV6_9BACT|nr:Uncharacterized protein dnm_098160 [Desulfonema magnum]